MDSKSRSCVANAEDNRIEKFCIKRQQVIELDFITSDSSYIKTVQIMAWLFKK